MALVTGSATEVETLDKHQRLPKIPLGLWPLILERVNRIELVIPWWGRTQLYHPKPEEANRAQVLYYLLQNSPLLRENN
jgi:hypothetical protein